MKKKSVSLSLTLLVMAFLSALLISACKEKEQTSTQAEEITLQTFATVLGKAEPQASGIDELRKEEQGLVVHYHLYLPEAQDFDELIGQDLAPKINQLYRAFKTIDKVTFEVETPDLAETGEYRPYCGFDMTRKIYNQLNWTNLLARDLFKVCKVNYSR
ncbi:MAG: hypothetical protein AB1715_01605 [Acidobacteriota bacterium]